jgi:hypothetical protein
MGTTEFTAKMLGFCWSSDSRAVNREELDLPRFMGSSRGRGKCYCGLSHLYGVGLQGLFVFMVNRFENHIRVHHRPSSKGHRLPEDKIP